MGDLTPEPTTWADTAELVLFFLMSASCVGYMVWQGIQMFRGKKSGFEEGPKK